MILANFGIYIKKEFLRERKKERKGKEGDEGRIRKERK